ncbi:hypothetical protein N657DRAFT_575691 [Parathielavia appendiculata]|uniref:Peptidase M48 domain-containing protein n=1 Tax=Parathielavia appendiculata TaxID=2587402 RepID=A0AAN6TX90_9PEZI|nr:hypothetical protein N657DRAFT_575691 [Parathielavia appendiculata]
MFRFFRPRPFFSQGSSVLRRQRPPSPRTPLLTESRSLVTSPSIFLNRPSPRSRPPQRCAAQPALFRRSPFPPPPSLQCYQHHQRRAYNYNGGPPPYDPTAREQRLRAANPLVHWRGWRALNTPSTYTIIAVSASAALIFYFANLETVPVSGRTRFNVYSADSVRRAGEVEYKRLVWDLERNGVRILGEWDPRTVRVRRVMERLIPFSGLAEEQEGEKWEVYVVDDPRTANAFVLPGGRVFVFSGILGLAGNDSGLATVLGHEIAHNLAGHHGERLSQDIGASIALWSLVILGGAFGLGPFLMHFFGSRFVDVAFGLPMSRMQEREADYIGLMMMAEACYDPREAPKFWARMQMATKGEEVPEWMSTHPTNINRIEKIQEWLPQAMEKRAQSDCRSTTAFADLFRQALRTGQVIII